MYAISDRITVMRNGEREGEYPRADLPRRLDRRDGRARAERRVRAAATHAGTAETGAAVLEARGVGRRGALNPIDLTCAPARSSASRACSARAARNGAAAVRRRTAATRRAAASTARRSSFDSPRDAVRHGIGIARKTARKKASSPSCRCARTSCWRCRRGAAGGACCRPRDSSAIGRRYVERSASSARRRAADRPALGRQPAEGAARALARDRAEPADPRRTDARHRRRGQVRNHGRDPARWRARGLAILFISSEIERGGARQRIASSCCATGARSARWRAGAREQAVYQLIAGGADA